MGIPIHKDLISCILSCLILLCADSAIAIDSEDILAVDEAFELSAELKNQEIVLLSWDIADSYYLYRHKFKFVSITPGLEAGEPLFPAGQMKKDDFFGTVEIYRDHLKLRLPLLHDAANTDNLVLEITFQGCADMGFCYMPVLKTVRFDLTSPLSSRSK